MIDIINKINTNEFYKLSDFFEKIDDVYYKALVHMHIGKITILKNAFIRGNCDCMLGFKLSNVDEFSVRKKSDYYVIYGMVLNNNKEKPNERKGKK